MKILTNKKYNKLMSHIAELEKKLLYAEYKLGYNVPEYDCVEWMTKQAIDNAVERIDRDTLRMMKNI
jgi:D-tyrosyl-tRNA(Tyr) deacylase